MLTPAAHLRSLHVTRRGVSSQRSLHGIHASLAFDPGNEPTSDVAAAGDRRQYIDVRKNIAVRHTLQQAKGERRTADSATRERQAEKICTKGLRRRCSRREARALAKFRGGDVLGSRLASISGESRSEHFIHLVARDKRKGHRNAQFSAKTPKLFTPKKNPLAPCVPFGKQILFLFSLLPGKALYGCRDFFLEHEFRNRFIFFLPNEIVL